MAAMMRAERLPSQKEKAAARWDKATEHRSIVIAIARAIGALLSRGTNQRVALFCAC